eukprot:753633-Hanusia_phi.AAC.3
MPCSYHAVLRCGFLYLAFLSGARPIHFRTPEIKRRGASRDSKISRALSAKGAERQNKAQNWRELKKWKEETMRGEADRQSKQGKGSIRCVEDSERRQDVCAGPRCWKLEASSRMHMRGNCHAR